MMSPRTPKIANENSDPAVGRLWWVAAGMHVSCKALHCAAFVSHTLECSNPSSPPPLLPLGCWPMSNVYLPSCPYHCIPTCTSLTCASPLPQVATVSGHVAKAFQEQRCVIGVSLAAKVGAWVGVGQHQHGISMVQARTAGVAGRTGQAGRWADMDDGWQACPHDGVLGC